ncbi:MAG: hypothetical protein WBB29_08970 [Geitlerinemataceae cyanobacterium]
MKAKTRCQQELGYLRGKVESLTQEVCDLNQTVQELRQLVASLSRTSPNRPMELGIPKMSDVCSLSENHHSISMEVG